MATGHNPILGRYRWPQVLLNQYDAGGYGEPAFRTAPTDITWSWRVNGVDLAVNAGSGVIGWNDLEEIWYGWPDDYYISYQMLDSTARTVGDWQVAAGVETGLGPRIDMNASGAFVLWIPMYSWNPEISRYQARVYGRRFDAAGVPLGAKFEVSQGVGTSGGDVAMAADGSSVFVWERSDNRLLGRRMDASGALVGDEFYIDSGSGSSSVSTPRIAMAADGSFVVTWNSTYGPMLRRYDASGNPLASEQSIFPTGSYPEISMAADGRFAIAWLSADGDGNGVFVQRYLADGTPFGSRLFVNDTAVAGSQDAARVAMRNDGTFVVTWSNNGAGFARWYDWNAPDEVLPFGPYIRSLTPTQPVAGPVSSVTVTFDRAVDAATFTTDDVTLTDPVGRLISAGTVTTGDNKTFTITFTAQMMPGRYRVQVGPNVADAAGTLMNQDGDAVNGESSADSFTGSFWRRPLQRGHPRRQRGIRGSQSRRPDRRLELRQRQWLDRPDRHEQPARRQPAPGVPERHRLSRGHAQARSVGPRRRHRVGPRFLGQGNRLLLVQRQPPGAVRQRRWHHLDQGRQHAGRE